MINALVVNLKAYPFTSVWTIWIRWERKIRTVWKTSSTPSYCIRSRTILNVINTPVLPTPALIRTISAKNNRLLLLSEHTCWTMNCNWWIFKTKLFFCLVYLSYKIYKAFSRFWYACKRTRYAINQWIFN